MFAPLALLLLAPAAADDFTPMFDGKSLAGWVNVNCAPGTFSVKNKEIVTTGEPTGFLRTARQYENFVMEFEWMHTREKGMANSGLFVWGDPLPAVGTGYTRGIEVQVLINYKPADGWATSHGDIFSIWGAKCVPDRPHHKGLERCLPSEDRVKGAGEWNHYKVTANDGAIKLAVNGKEVSGASKCDPRKGYLALESEGSECRFRNLRIKELPTTNPKPAECAKVDEGHVSLFDGLTLAGWTGDGWKPHDGVLTAGKGDLVSAKTFGPAEFVFDVKLPAKKDESNTFNASFGGSVVTFNPKPGVWQRVRVNTADGTATIVGDPRDSGPTNGKATPPGPMTIQPAAGLEVRNLFVREIKGK